MGVLDRSLMRAVAAAEWIGAKLQENLSAIRDRQQAGRRMESP